MARIFVKHRDYAKENGRGMSEKYISSSALLYLVLSVHDGAKNKREEWLLNQVVEKINFLPAANVIVLNWMKFPDHKPTAYKPVLATLNNKDREVIEACYDPRKDCWCYPHSFGTSVEGKVIAWAEKMRGYNGD